MKLIASIMMHTPNSPVVLRGYFISIRNIKISTNSPFNPTIKVRYSVPQSSQVVVKVFDVLGNEIETLVNEEKPIGSYEVDFSASNLPSGIYFYKLQTGTSVETKRMILLK